MTGSAIVAIAWLAAAGVLSIAALGRRRMPPARLAGLALVWAAVFAGGYLLAVLVGTRHDG